MSNQEKNQELSNKKTFYITTPIYYPSDNPHIGHTFCTVYADSMKRYKKMRGYDAYFLTGTDEHGQKIQRRAAAAGMEPKAFVDGIVANFKQLWELMMVDYDDFLRTTDDRHKKVVRDLLQTIYDRGDIYKSEYEGWYCSPCETFYTERQVGEGKTCTECGRPLEKMKEESYFFRMGEYADRLLKHIEDNPDFIQPVSRRNEMVNFIKQGLEDLCISRTTFDWGIELPFDSGHVTYVWFDALTNYISALNYGQEDDSLYQKYWPAVHLVGKDIIRFHTIIWPIMLMAGGVPLPQKVVGTGWVLLGGDKMSKSKGNIIDSAALVGKYGIDAVRYFLLREMPFGQDANYSEELLVTRINNDLANDYGNLLSRTTAMINKFQDGIVNPPDKYDALDDELLQLSRETIAEVEKYFDGMDFSAGLAAVMRLVGKANKYIDDAAPWALNKSGDKERLATVLYNLTEVIRLATVMLTPVMPTAPAKVWAQLGIADRAELTTWESLTDAAYPTGVTVARGDSLFPRVDPASLDLDAPAVQDITTEEVAELPFEDVLPEISIDDFDKLDLRVAEVIECEKVPKSNKLLKLSLLVSGERRTVVSGIAKYYQPEELLGRHVVIIANLKPVTLFGIESHGMVLCASHGDKLELLGGTSLAGGAKIS